MCILIPKKKPFCIKIHRYQTYFCKVVIKAFSKPHKMDPLQSVQLLPP